MVWLRLSQNNCWSEMVIHPIIIWFGFKLFWSKQPQGASWLNRVVWRPVAQLFPFCLWLKASLSHARGHWGHTSQLYFYSTLQLAFKAKKSLCDCWKHLHTLYLYSPVCLLASQNYVGDELSWINRDTYGVLIFHMTKDNQNRLAWMINYITVLKDNHVSWAVPKSGLP